MGWEALAARFPLLGALRAPRKLQTTRLTLGRRFGSRFLNEAAVVTRLALEVLLAFLELCHTIYRKARVRSSHSARVAHGHQILTRLTPCLRHVVAINAFTSACIWVGKLVQASIPAHTTTRLNCQEFRCTHSAHISVETLLTARESRAAQLALAIVKVVPGFTLPASSLIVAVAGDASLNLTGSAATPGNKHVVLTPGASLTRAVNTLGVFHLAV